MNQPFLADGPVLDWLDRLAELRVPSRLAAEWARLTGAPLVLFDPARRRGRRLSGDHPSLCLGPSAQGDWPACLPERVQDAPAPHRCAHGRGVHFVHPIRPNGEAPRAYLVSGEVRRRGHGALSGERLDLLREWLRIIAEEMESFLARIAMAIQPAGIFSELVGQAPALQRVRAELQRAVGVRYPVLLVGESGTGKDLSAWIVHHRGARESGSFVTLNCAALPDTLLESALFGHHRGAFTGADRDKPGLFTAARGGTIFLDEIQQMSLASQAKLLRVVESGEFLPLGSVKAEASDARLVVATNSDLEQLVDAGTFRKDLFYRLSVLTISLPPLREMRGDIPALTHHYVRLICEREGLPLPQVSPEAMAALLTAPWPGNVRQLIHELERALLLCAGGELRPEHLSGTLPVLAPRRGTFAAMRESVVAAWEREEFRAALERNSWNVAALARELSLSRRWLTDKLARYGLRRPKAAVAEHQALPPHPS